MSHSTRSSALERALMAVVIAAACAAAPAAATLERAPPLPAGVVALAPDLKVQGGGELTYFGISVYDGWYWSPVRGWPHGGPHALDLIYHRNLDGTKIAQRSVDEIAKLGYGSDAERTRWGQLMARLFPDVRRGDRLTGVYTGAGAVRYFHNGKSIGEIAEPGFAQAFFGIWLDPKTSRADFRQKLLGQP
ncbi:MAG: chalcone isomerase family protein [Betaproteobacteria bacterium]